MKILVFGMLVEDTGTAEVNIENAADSNSLRAWLLRTYPSLKNKSFMIAVNRQVASENTEIKPGDEIALIPPFAGG